MQQATLRGTASPSEGGDTTPEDDDTDDASTSAHVRTLPTRSVLQILTATSRQNGNTAAPYSRRSPHFIEALSMAATATAERPHGVCVDSTLAELTRRVKIVDAERGTVRRTC